ncbi:unnamed protein product [Brugia timori]|uniref:Zf-Sec23_Sec24 domain-containing protein n=1 Tax=Brugia timori TaxID=42155 RepID=A0A0R3QQG0_9BILA|nr:unnamed protein product [Brugia timori]
MANSSASIQSTFDISKFTRPISELLFSTTDNRIQPLLPLFSLPFPNQYPINLITNDITFSRGLCPICGRIYGSFKDFQVSVYRSFFCPILGFYPFI